LRTSTHIGLRSSSSSSSGGGGGRAVVVLLSALAIAACDAGTAATDASTPIASNAAQIALRVDVQPAAAASLSALAYRAAYSGISRREVLGLVDPLAGGVASRVPATSATGGRAEAEPGCVIRDLDRASTDLAAHGDSIELEELKGIAVSAIDSTLLPTRAELLRLSPRLFPDIAASIGGVVSEGGPVGLPELPGQVRVTEGSASAVNGASEADVALPAPAWIRLVNGAASAAGQSISMGSDLQLGLSIPGSAETTVELRPLGATVALTCTVPIAVLAQAQAAQAPGVPPSGPGGVGSLASTTTQVASTGAAGTGAGAGAPGDVPAGDTSFALSRQLLARLVAAAGGIPGAPIAAALDVVRRSEQTLTSASGSSPSGSPSSSPPGIEISVEIRTSTLVELRP
jgi:hypothetical protein